MIKLATVFSGIGAIEHALQRMQLENEIIFACDNGDVELFSKKIGMNIDEIGEELKTLSEIIKGIKFNDEVEDLYKEQLDSMLAEAVKEYKVVLSRINDLPEIDSDFVKKSLEIALLTEDAKSSKAKKYAKYLAEIRQGSDCQVKFTELQVIIELANDFKRSSSFDEILESSTVASGKVEDKDSNLELIYKEYEKFEGYGAKRIVRKVQDLSQRASQLHEKISYLDVQRHLETMGDDWNARKEYVDALYTRMEKRNKVKTSYMANYNIKEEQFHWNVAFLNGMQYRDKVDLFVGGSPCQSFSLVGKQRGLEDTRGTLFYEYARLIKEIKPKVFIYENVKAVTSNDGGKTWEKMQQVFAELGYNFDCKILNAKDFGIPQNRERLFVVGFREDLKLEKKFEFPNPIKLDKKMKDFLIDNAPGGYFLPRKGVEFVTMEKNLTKKFTQIDGEVQLCQKKNQQFNWHGDFVFQSEEEAVENGIPDLEKYFLSEKVVKYVMATGTKNFYSRPKTDLDVARPLLTTMHKMHRAGVDNYVTTDGRLRKLTPRECLRLMGFSDTFKIEVSDTSMYQQAGNSIVVDVLIHIMNKILESYPKLVEED